MSGFSTRAATREHLPALAALFEREGSACYCRWWHFAGDKNAWLDRLAHHPDENRAELLASDPSGVIAFADDLAIGWMKLAPAEAMDKLYAQKPYRGLSCFRGDREGIYVIGCFIVDPAWRRRGVSRALVAAGIEIARAWGARAIEAFPRAAEPVSEELLWTGAPSVLRDAGFSVVDDSGPYPVYRRELA